MKYQEGEMRKVGLVIALLLVFASRVGAADAETGETLDQAVKGLATQLAERLPNRGPLSVAPMDFRHVDGSCVSGLSRYVADDLMGRLMQTRRVRFVERALLDETMRELTFGVQDLVKPSTTARLGHQTSADAILTGVISDLGATVKISTRLVEVETSHVLASAGATVRKDEAVARLMGQIVRCGSGLPTAHPPSAIPPAPSARSGWTQEFPELRVEMEHVTRGQDRVIVLLRYSNKTDREQVIGLVAPGIRFREGQRTYLVDRGGTMLVFTGGSGLAGGWGFGIRSWADGTTWLRVPPHSSAQASLTFQQVKLFGGIGVWEDVSPTLDLKPGVSLSFFSEQAFVEHDRPERRFTVAIRDFHP